MTFLEQLVDDINTELGVRIDKPGRKRETVYARKLFCYIAGKLNYGPTAIGRVFNKDHATALFHKNTFKDVVRVREFEAYNAIVRKRELPLDIIENIRVLKQSPTMKRVINKIASLEPKDLKYFEANRLDTFIESIEKEKIFKFQLES